MNVLQHISTSGNFLLATNYLDVASNEDLDLSTAYRFRPQNFLLPPYNLVDPICEDEETGCVNALYKLPLQQKLGE